MLTFTSVVILLLIGAAVFQVGPPRMDSTADPLRPRNSPAYAALAEVRKMIAGEKDPWRIVLSGRSETEVGALLAQTHSALSQAVSNGTLSTFTLPTSLWPRPLYKSQNQEILNQLAARRSEFHNAAPSHGFAPGALGLADAVLDTWQKVAKHPAGETYWPTNHMSRWIFDRVAARAPGQVFALGIARTPSNSVGDRATQALALQKLERSLPAQGVWLSGWELLGQAIFDRVMAHFPFVVVPMIGLVILSLWFAFRRLAEVLLSVGVLCLSTLYVLAVMRLTGWTSNLMNLMALPLILGTGVDYGIFVQLALRRHQGSWPAAYRSVGRALLLCGGTAIAGFGSLAFSGNSGMASLGSVCATGITAQHANRAASAARRLVVLRWPPPGRG